MKSISSWTSAVCILLMMTSCAKENATSSNEQVESLVRSDEESTGSNHPCMDKVVNMGDVLSFQNDDHFNKIRICLQDMVDGHNDAFDNLYGNLTDDEIEEVEEEIGFHEFQPLIDFEYELGFSSLRGQIEEEVDAWLLNDNLDLLPDPDDHIIIDEIIRSMLNTECEVIIDGQVQNLCNIAEEQSNCFNTAHTISSPFYYENGNKRFTVEIQIKRASWINFNSKIKAKIKSYKRKNNGGWKRHKTRLSIAAHGMVLGTSACQFAPHYQVNFSKGPKRRKKLTVRKNLGDPRWTSDGLLGGTGTIVDAQENGTIWLSN